MEKNLAPTAEFKEKPDFYVFLDFDGVLYDLKSLGDNLPSFKDLFSEDKKLSLYSSDSIETINRLFDHLKTKYDVHLVISSFWRFFKTPLLIKWLESNGLDTTGITVDKTRITAHPHKRGLEIKEFLQRHNNCNNLVILDDSYRENYLKHFLPQQIVTTNIFNDRLIAKKLDTSLKFYGLTPISTDEINQATREQQTTIQPTKTVTISPSSMEL